jgi:CHAD domain-containing protein
MSYRFRKPDRLAFEVRRVAGERLEHALRQLDEKLGEHPAKAVHEARKDLKKTRSLLRLVRDSLGEERYRAENDRLRDAAHLLAGAREADAKVESLAALIEHVGDEMGQVASNEARAWLTALRAQRGTHPEVHQSATQAAALIRRSRDEARLWALGYGSFEIVGPGLRRTYRQGRRLLDETAQDPSDETTHEWRKRVKDLWYSLRLVGAAWPPVLSPTADQAHKLSELLGDHHDLGEVRLAIEAGGIGLLPEASAELLGHVRARQTKLHDEAISIGQRLYAEKPGGYVTRLEGLWEAWAENCAQQLGQDGLPGS